MTTDCSDLVQACHRVSYLFLSCVEARCCKVKETCCIYNTKQSESVIMKQNAAQ